MAMLKAGVFRLFLACVELFFSICMWLGVFKSDVKKHNCSKFGPGSLFAKERVVLHVTCL